MNRRNALIVAGAVLCVGVAAVFIALRGSPLVRLEWERTIAVEKLDVQRGSDWRDQLPAGAEVVKAEPRFHHKDRTQTGTRKVMVKVDGTQTLEVRPTFDEKDVSMDWCEWEQRRWLPARVEKASGQGAAASWPAAKLGPGEREGARSESYRAVFERDGAEVVVTVPLARWATLEAGSRYRLKVDASGATLLE